jgi:AcrR family transcriptional regulator
VICIYTRTVADAEQTTDPGARERGKLHTRERLRNAAKELFEERGYDHVTVAEIAARAGVSAKTLFQHFRSKEDLLIGELDDVHQDLVRALRERDPSTTPLEAVTGWLLDWPAQRPPDAFDRFIRMVGSRRSVESMRRRLYDEWENAIVGVLADEANEARPAPHTRLVAAQLVAMIRVLTSPEVRAFVERYPPDGRPQAYREAVVDAAAQLARGLRSV